MATAPAQPAAVETGTVDHALVTERHGRAQELTATWQTSGTTPAGLAVVPPPHHLLVRRAGRVQRAATGDGHPPVVSSAGGAV